MPFVKEDAGFRFISYKSVSISCPSLGEGMGWVLAYSEYPVQPKMPVSHPVFPLAMLIAAPAGLPLFVSF